jgi:flagellar biosynthetic protein FliR
MLELLQRTATQLVPYLPAAARVLAMAAVAPGVSLPAVPSQARLLFALALAVILSPLARPLPAHLLSSPDRFLVLVVAEGCLGLLIGLVAALLLEAARYAGDFIELQSGLRVAEFFDPSQQAPASLLGHLYYLTALVLFFDFNGHHVLLGGLSHSLQVLPPGSLYFAPGLGRLATDLLAAGFLVALSLALPTLAALLLTDLAFGLVARLVTRFQIFFVSLPAKMAVGLLSLAISAPLLAHLMAQTLALLTDFLFRLTGP